MEHARIGIACDHALSLCLCNLFSGGGRYFFPLEPDKQRSKIIIIIIIMVMMMMMMMIPRVARLINLSGQAEGPSGAKAREFERKIYIYIYIYVYMYISLKVSAMLPSNSEKQSMNDVRQREGC